MKLSMCKTTPVRFSSKTMRCRKDVLYTKAASSTFPKANEIPIKRQFISSPRIVQPSLRAKGTVIRNIALILENTNTGLRVFVLDRCVKQSRVAGS